MKKKYLAVLLTVVVLIAYSVPAFAIESEHKEYEIDSIQELEIEAESVAENGDCTKEEAEELFNSAAPEVVAEFVKDKMNEADEVLSESGFDICENLDVFGRCKVEFELEDGCVAQFEFETGSEKNLIGWLGDYLVIDCSAVDNGETKWQDYGNHYFTAKKTVWYGVVGLGKIILENHYKLDKNGITERYGEAAVSGVGIGAEITARNPVITDYKARTKGKSDVNMYCVYDYAYEFGPIDAQGNFTLNTRVIYLDKNSSDKKIKVQFMW